jgi:hypothetical protein
MDLGRSSFRSMNGIFRAGELRRGNARMEAQAFDLPALMLLVLMQQ